MIDICSDGEIPVEPQLKFQRILVEKLNLALRGSFSPSLLGEMTIEAVADAVTRQFVYFIKGGLYGTQNEEVLETILVPKDWLESVKERFLPDWLKRNFPVRHRKIDVLRKVHYCCPHLNVASQTRHLQFMLNGPAKEEQRCPRCGERFYIAYMKEDH